MASQRDNYLHCVAAGSVRVPNQFRLYEKHHRALWDILQTYEATLGDLFHVSESFTKLGEMILALQADANRRLATIHVLGSPAARLKLLAALVANVDLVRDELMAICGIIEGFRGAPFSSVGDTFRSIRNIKANLAQRGTGPDRPHLHRLAASGEESLDGRKEALIPSPPSTICISTFVKRALPASHHHGVRWDPVLWCVAVLAYMLWARTKTLLSSRLTTHFHLSLMALCFDYVIMEERLLIRYIHSPLRVGASITIFVGLIELFADKRLPHLVLPGANMMFFAVTAGLVHWKMLEPSFVLATGYLIYRSLTLGIYLLLCFMLSLTSPRVYARAETSAHGQTRGEALWELALPTFFVSLVAYANWRSYLEMSSRLDLVSWQQLYAW